MNSTANKH